jgi:hypothetical protein
MKASTKTGKGIDRADARRQLIGHPLAQNWQGDNRHNQGRV